MNVDLFIRYFNNCPVLRCKFKYFYEDFLITLNFLFFSMIYMYKYVIYNIGKLVVLYPRTKTVLPLDVIFFSTFLVPGNLFDVEEHFLEDVLKW